MEMKLRPAEIPLARHGIRKDTERIVEQLRTFGSGSIKSVLVTSDTNRKYLATKLNNLIKGHEIKGVHAVQRTSDTGELDTYLEKV